MLLMAFYIVCIYTHGWMEKNGNWMCVVVQKKKRKKRRRKKAQSRGKAEKYNIEKKKMRRREIYGIFFFFFFGCWKWKVYIQHWVIRWKKKKKIRRRKRWGRVRDTDKYWFSIICPMIFFFHFVPHSTFHFDILFKLLILFLRRNTRKPLLRTVLFLHFNIFRPILFLLNLITSTIIMSNNPNSHSHKKLYGKT